jgi:uncharacterized membrane protein YgcG
MTGRRRRFERALNELDAQGISIDECVEHYAADDPELASTLRLAAAVRAARPLGDLQPMRLRVETALLAGMNGLRAEDGTATQPGRHAQLSQAHAGKSGYARLVSSRTRIGLAAAVLLVVVAVGWVVSMLAQGALPESALYAVKRGDEWMALHVAWSDQQRGEVLAAIAAHRLTEACAEAAHNHPLQMRAVIDELNVDMGQLIALTAEMAAHHENTTAVANALARDLNEEYSAILAAQRAGQTSLAQALAGSIQAQQKDIQHYKLSLPPSGSTTSQGTGQATPPSPNSDPHSGLGAGKPTPTPPGQGPGGSGSGSGSGQSDGQGGNQGGGHGSGPGGNQGGSGSGGQEPHAALQAMRTVGVAESIAVPIREGSRQGVTRCQARVRQ